MKLGPSGIRRVGTVIDDGRAVARPIRPGRLRDVRDDDLHAFWQVGSAASADGSYPFSSRRQMSGHGEARWTRPADDVKTPPLTHALRS
jgi:hypothetical protein